jgi:hypothetical protein
VIVAGLSDDENRILNRLLAGVKRHESRNFLRSSYYDGRRAINDVGGVVPETYRNLAIVLGWAAKGVDGLARRCNLDDMVWPDGDLPSLGMAVLADSNFLYSELSQGRTDSLIHGVSYLITTQGVQGEPKALVHAKDALNAYGEWNPRKRALDNLVSITSRKDNLVTGFVLYLDGVTITAEKGSSGWTVDRSEHPWGVPAEPLIYHPRASRRLGRSRITRPAMSLQDSALRALRRLEAHMDIYAIPKLMILGADESMFKNPDGSPKASWQVVMGRVLGIPDDDDANAANPRASVEQLSAESPTPHLAQLNALAKLTAREYDLPDSDFAMTDLANPTSADAYNASRENLIAEAEGATADWSVPIRRTVTRALAIQNGLEEVPAQWSTIAPKWRSPIYVSKAAQADAGAKQLSLVPWLADTPVGLELLGLSQQQIDLAMAEKRRAAGRAVIAALAPKAATNADGA